MPERTVEWVSEIPLGRLAIIRRDVVMGSHRSDALGIADLRFNDQAHGRALRLFARDIQPQTLGIPGYTILNKEELLVLSGLADDMPDSSSKRRLRAACDVARYAMFSERRQEHLEAIVNGFETVVSYVVQLRNHVMTWERWADCVLGVLRVRLDARLTIDPSSPRQCGNSTRVAISENRTPNAQHVLPWEEL